MTVERAKEHLREYGRDLDVLEFDVSSATVELAAKAIECAPERIAKTLSWLTMVLRSLSAQEMRASRTLSSKKRFIARPRW